MEIEGSPAPSESQSVPCLAVGLRRCTAVRTPCAGSVPARIPAQQEGQRV